MFVPILYGANTIMDIFSPFVFETIIICILLYFSGFVINSLTDREIDKLYGTFKSEIPEAVELIGVKRVKIILGFQVGIALILSLHLSMALSNIWIMVLACAGVLFGLGYSAEPFYFKVKGVWHAISLGSSAFFIPLMFIYLVVARTVDILGVLLIIGVTIAHYSLAMANQAADHLEDSRNNIRTPPVRLGLERILKWSIAITTCGMIMIMIILGAIYISSDAGTAMGSFGGSIQFPAVYLLMIPILIILSVGYYVPIKGLRDLYALSMESIPVEKRMEKIKKRINYATWQASGIASITVVLAILFAANHLPVWQDGEGGFEAESVQGLDFDQLRISSVVITAGNEGKSNNYADVDVKLSFDNSVDPNDLENIMVLVDVGSGNQIFETGYNNVDSAGSAVVRVDLDGKNESKVWYSVYLLYEDQRSSFTWTQTSSSQLYIFDTVLTIKEELLYDEIELTVYTFNAGAIRDPNSITLKIEWSPFFVDWSTNNQSINPQEVWEKKVDREFVKGWIADSHTIKIFLYYDDKEYDVIELKY